MSVKCSWSQPTFYKVEKTLFWQLKWLPPDEQCTQTKGREIRTQRCGTEEVDSDRGRCGDQRQGWIKGWAGVDVGRSETIDRYRSPSHSPQYTDDFPSYLTVFNTSWA